MKAVIQHNFSSGLGDCIIAIYQYIDTAINLKSLGYEVDLIINQNKNLYFDKKDFFEIFNLEFFSEIFTNVKVLLDHETFHQESLHHVFTLGNASPGMHWWDLFCTETNSLVTSCIKTYCLYPVASNPLPTEKNIFHSNVHEIYNNNNAQKNAYCSVYFRTLDYHDGDRLYNKFKNEISEVVKSNDQVFVCSNSVVLKSMFKQRLYPNVFFNNIHKESEYGNHWGDTLTLKRSDSILKTIHTICDMLCLKNSNHVYHFSEWTRTSNFLFLSKICNVPISSFYI